MLGCSGVGKKLLIRSNIGVLYVSTGIYHLRVSIERSSHRAYRARAHKWVECREIGYNIQVTGLRVLDAI